jgi:hypothetical protein
MHGTGRDDPAERNSPVGRDERMRVRVVPAGCACGRPQRLLHRLDAAYVLAAAKARPSVVRADGGAECDSRRRLAAVVEPHRRQLTLCPTVRERVTTRGASCT